MTERAQMIRREVAIGLTMAWALILALFAAAYLTMRDRSALATAFVLWSPVALVLGWRMLRHFRRRVFTRPRVILVCVWAASIAAAVWAIDDSDSPFAADWVGVIYLVLPMA